MFDISPPHSPHGFAANTYILRSNGECAVIDPTVPFEMVKVSDKVKYIFLTHSHFDHILEIDSWKNSTDASVIVSVHEKDGPADSDFNCYRIFTGKDEGYRGPVSVMKDGDEFTIGAKKLTVMECPGHTKGCVALVGDGMAFVGDTVFAGGGYGRWDLPSGDYRALRQSINKLLSLPDEMILYPGHGESTTIREFKKHYLK